MQIKTTPIEGLLIIEPQVFNDPRGYFYESYNKEKMYAAGIDIEFVQDNQSLSQKGIVRGLHFQAAPFAQAKLVRVIQGAVMDVAVDIRKNSPTYGQHFAIELSAENKTMFYIPPGFAHGFETLADNTLFLYKCSNLYNKESEGGLLWNDEQLNIKWQTKNPLVSDKDKVLPSLNNFISPF
ncbi:MAG: dTDP-4-dehydrorhamnose 3,5-epimerase [Bacteroidota bacterium]